MHASAHLFLREHFGVSADFRIEFPVISGGGEDISKEVFQSRECGHSLCSLLLREPRTLPGHGRWPRKFGPSAGFLNRAGGGRLWSGGKIWRGDYFRTRPRKRLASLLLPCDGERGRGSRA